MHVNRSQIVDILRARALDERADWTEVTLPEIVDTTTNAGLLTTLAIDAPSLLPVEVAAPGSGRDG